MVVLKYHLLTKALQEGYIRKSICKNKLNLSFFINSDCNFNAPLYFYKKNALSATYFSVKFFLIGLE